MRCVDLYNQSQSKWFEEMVTTSLVRLLCISSFSLMVNLYVAYCFGSLGASLFLLQPSSGTVRLAIGESGKLQKGFV